MSIKSVLGLNSMTLNHPDRPPSDTFTRGLARELFKNIEGLPIISPHGHCDPSWFSENKGFQILLNFCCPRSLCLSHVS